MSADTPHRPKSYPAVAPDFDGPVLVETMTDLHETHGRFVSGHFYTDEATEATVFSAVDGREQIEYWSCRYLVSAELVLADERARLEAFADRIEAVKSGKEKA